MKSAIAPLSTSQIKDLKAQAHHLDPVVLVGAAGLTEAVLREFDLALTAHELVKARLGGEDRTARAAMAEDIRIATGCAVVQLIGKMAVLYRPRPEKSPGSGPHVPKQMAAAHLAREAANARRGSAPARQGGPSRKVTAVREPAAAAGGAGNVWKSARVPPVARDTRAGKPVAGEKRTAGGKSAADGKAATGSKGKAGGKAKAGANAKAGVRSGAAAERAGRTNARRPRAKSARD